MSRGKLKAAFDKPPAQFAGERAEILKKAQASEPAGKRNIELQGTKGPLPSIYPCSHMASQSYKSDPSVPIKLTASPEAGHWVKRITQGSAVPPCKGVDPEA